MSQSLCSLEAERAILGGILLGRWIELDPGDFYRASHRLIYTAARDLLSQGRPVDLVTAYEEIKKRGQTEEVGGASYLSDLVDTCVITDTSLSAYGTIVQEYARRRELVGTGATLAERARTEPLADVIDAGRESIEKVAATSSTFQHTPNAKYLLTQIRAEQTIIKDRGYGLKPGYDFLTKAIRGIRPRRLWIIGGYTSVGKSQFAVELCKRVMLANPGVVCAIFSLEMEAMTYAVRMLASYADVHPQNILLQEFTPEEADSVDEATDWLNSQNFYVWDSLYSLSSIFHAARTIKNLNILVIDYVQNLDHKGSIYELTSTHAPRLLAAAKSMNCTIIGLSQIPDEAADQERRAIRFKGGGEWAANADLGIWLDRSKDDPRLITANIRKNRHGPTGKKTLRFNANWTRIEEDL